MEKLVKFEVGKRAPYPFDSVPVRDGAIIEMDAEGSLHVAIYLNKMNAKEKDTLTKCPIESGYFAEPPYWLGLIKLGNLIFELQFDPMKHIQAGRTFSAESFRHDYLLLTVPIIDSATMIIHGIRAVTMPPKLMDSLYLTYSQFNQHPTYSSIYEVFLSGLQSQQLETLWKQAEKTGTFGED